MPLWKLSGISLLADKKDSGVFEAQVCFFKGDTIAILPF